jgi:hypothetical protein
MAVLSRSNHSTTISLGEISSTAGIEVSFGPDPKLDVVDMPARLHEMIYRCETDYQQKEEVWKLVTEDGAPVHVRMQKLFDMGLDERMRDAVLEIWFADGRAAVGGIGASQEMLLQTSRSLSSSSWGVLDVGRGSDEMSRPADITSVT